MCVIFAASGDPGSFQHSSRIIGPLVRWLFPHLSDEAVHAIVVLARKGAHLAEYAVLALLLWHALRQAHAAGASAWRWSRAGLVLLLVALFAGTDELHQAFVPARDASIRDVMLDTLGGALALFCLWTFSRFRKG